MLAFSVSLHRSHFVTYSIPVTIERVSDSPYLDRARKIAVHVGPMLIVLAIRYDDKVHYCCGLACLSFAELRFEVGRQVITTRKASAS